MSANGHNDAPYDLLSGGAVLIVGWSGLRCC